MRIALTGGTGFLGGHVLRRLVAAGHEVRALARRAQTATAGVTWEAGALDDRRALDRLCTGADAVVHVAGVVNAPDRAGFEQGNVVGTENVLAAAEAAGVVRFVHVSSLSAREPDMSNYGASKARAEARVLGCALDVRVVRPPAIYGPGDGDNLELFRLAKVGVIPLPPRGRLSVIHADDLARLIVALAEAEAAPRLMEADDGRANGWSHREWAAAIARAVGRRALPLPLPAALIRLAAKGDRLVRGDKARLTPDRASYFCHPDWVIDRAARPPAALWQPAIATEQGLVDTALWYRTQGWL